MHHTKTWGKSYEVSYACLLLLLIVVTFNVECYLLCDNIPPSNRSEHSSTLEAPPASAAIADSTESMHTSNITIL